MYVQSPNLGELGILPDQPQTAIPIGGWTDARNMRFNDGYIERINEPNKVIDTEVGQTGEWLQLYEDVSGPRQVYASQGKLYRLAITGDSWEDVTNVAIGTYGDGEWQSFQYGTSVVFNNGVDPPQILYSNAGSFVTLPNWGVVTIGGTPTQQTVTCRALRLFGSYMVAMDLTIDGTRSPNGVWTSDPASIDNVQNDSEMPSWNYADPATRATLNYIGVEFGAIVDGLELNNNFIIYTRESAHILQLIGGNFVFGNRKALPYGIASLGSVANYLNFHFCVGPTTLYIHNGSTVEQIADARVNDYFYGRLSNFDAIRCTENQDKKEIHTLYNSVSGREYLIFNYKNNNWSVGDALVGTEPAQCMAYGLRLATGGETYNTITTTYATETRTYAQLQQDGETRTMYWLTTLATYEAELLTAQSATKEYYVTRGGIDFSEINPAMTTNQSKSLHQIVPHIEGQAQTQFTITSGQTLRGIATAQQVLQYDPATQYKLDTRITGRWISMRIELTTDGDWRMSTMDYDVEVDHDR